VSDPQFRQHRAGGLSSSHFITAPYLGRGVHHNVPAKGGTRNGKFISTANVSPRRSFRAHLCLLYDVTAASARCGRGFDELGIRTQALVGRLSTSDIFIFCRIARQVRIGTFGW